MASPAMDRLKEEATKLLNTTMSTPVVDEADPRASYIIYDQMRSATALVQDLKALCEAENELLSSDAAKDVIMEEAEVKQKITDLQEQILEANWNSQRKRLLIERLQKAQAMVPVLYQPTDEKTSDRDSDLREKVQVRDEYVSKLLEVSAALRQAEGEVEKTRMERRDLMMKNRKLWQDRNASTLQEDEEGDPITLKKLRKRIQGLKANNTIVYHILEAMILDSGVNWAEDEELKNIILQGPYVIV